MIKLKSKKFTDERNTIIVNTLAIPNSGVFEFEIELDKGSAILEDHFYSIYKKELWGGLHMLEHMCFKSPGKYISKEILEKLKKTGARNAHTSFSSISFHHNSVEKYREFTIDAVISIAMNDLKNVTKEEFEKEKDVVINEVKRYNGDKNLTHQFQANGLTLFGNKDNNLLGAVEILEKITLEDLIKLKYILMSKSNYIINIVYDPEYHFYKNINRFIADIVKKVNVYKNERPISSFTNVNIPYDMKQQYSSIKMDSSVDKDRAIISYSMPIDVLDVVFVLGKLFMTDLAGENSFFNIFREKYGLTYGVSYYYTFDANGNKVFYFTVDIESKNINLAKKLFKKIMINGYKHYTKDKHLEVVDKYIINEKSNLSLKKYKNIFTDTYKLPSEFKKYKKYYESNCLTAKDAILELDGVYKKVYNHLKELSKQIKKKKYIYTVTKN